MTSAREHADRLADLLRRERHALGDFLLSLAAFDAKRGWRELGYPSLFQFLRTDLKLSAGAAQNRKTAAELVQRFPRVEPALRDGRLCMSTVTEIARVIDAGNADEILPRFFGLSRREAAEVAVTIRPAPVIPRLDVVRPLRPAAPAQVEISQPRPEEPPPAALHPCEPRPDLTLAPPAPTPPPPATVKPLDAELARLHITVSRNFLAKLADAKDQLAHARPGATTEDVLDAALDALIEKKRAKRWGLARNPRKTPPPSSRDDVFPAHVRRTLWERAGGRCECLLPNGERCGESRWLELDHIRPRALGGKATLANGRVACRAHNQDLARRVFGDAWMDGFTRKRRARPAPPGPDPAGPVAAETS